MLRLLKRIATAFIGLPLVIILVNLGGLPLIGMLIILSLVGLNELYGAFSHRNKAIHWIGYTYTVSYYGFISYFGVSSWLLVMLTLFIITSQTMLVLFYKHISMQDCIITVFGFFYVSFLLSFIYLVRDHEMGRYYVWLIFTSSFGCDTFAYLTGITIGKHKLKDTPSPGKSIEGVLGGVIGAALVGWLYGLSIYHVFNLHDVHIIINSTVISLFGAVFSIIGDLFASAVKRHTGIKDFGKVLPGHGGVLDRFDSVIVTAPIVYMVITAVIWLSVR